MIDRNEQLKKILAGEGDMADAFVIVRVPNDYNEGEIFVAEILRTNKEIPELDELLNDALQGFLNSHENRYKQHGYWVHSLSHFTNKLWKRRMDAWIKKLNEIAFTGANELGNSACCDRLVDDFVGNAKWDDDPADFGLTIGNLSWIKWEDNVDLKSWIEYGPFDSEVQFLRFKLQQPWEDKWSDTCQCKLPGIGKEEYIRRLKELGADTEEFEKRVTKILSHNLKKLEGIPRDGKKDWLLKRLDSEIAEIRARLKNIYSASD